MTTTDRQVRSIMKELSKHGDQGKHLQLMGVDVLPSLLSGTRRIVDCIFSYTNRNTDFAKRFFVRIDVSQEFPFWVTKMSPVL
jgi:PatG C-terminal